MRPNEVRREAAARDLLQPERDRNEDSTVVQETEAYKVDCSSFRPENERNGEIAECEEA